MKLVRDLSDEQLTDLLLEDDEREMQQALGALPAQLRAAAERPENFWQKQRAAIDARLPGLKRGPIWATTAWAAALSLVLLSVLLWHEGRKSTVPTSSPTLATADSDQELLLSVEQTVQSDGPDALEPAALLAQEMGGQDLSQFDTPVSTAGVHHSNRH